jgi:hypothetical protein
VTTHIANSTLLMIVAAGIYASLSVPSISSASIHMTLMMPKAHASKTPKIHEKYHIGDPPNPDNPEAKKSESRKHERFAYHVSPFTFLLSPFQYAVCVSS